MEGEIDGSHETIWGTQAGRLGRQSSVAGNVPWYCDVAMYHCILGEPRATLE